MRRYIISTRPLSAVTNVSLTCQLRQSLQVRGTGWICIHEGGGTSPPVKISVNSSVVVLFSKFIPWMMLTMVMRATSNTGMLLMVGDSTGGRAGRHGKQWEFGEVTCLRTTDMPYMNHVRRDETETEGMEWGGVDGKDTNRRGQRWRTCLPAWYWLL